MANKNTSQKTDDIEFEDEPLLPPGWQAMAKQFKKRAQREDGSSHIISLEEVFGSLECSCQLSSYADQAFMIDMHNFRRKSHHTCFACGSGNAHRAVVNAQVEVYCDDCKVKIQEMDKQTIKTNTWLDNF